MSEFWCFDMESEEYGPENFGPYLSLDEALEGIGRVMRRCIDLDDGVERAFSAPYRVEPSILWSILQGELA